MKFIAALAGLLAVSNADMYMQNPRGCNDRLNEANTDRNNANRLFDSQNNAKGGFCYGPAMSFYEGSLLSVEWTAQHGCGINEKLVCNIVLQYICSNSDADPVDLVRDGVTTNTITNNAGGATATTNGELTYGMHENYAYYQACATRQRNKGLWINDRNLGGNAATYTRQNNNANRHGYECAEERDYYPYWAPVPWVDVAILTHSMDWCDFYRAESFNVKSRWICTNNGVQAAPNNQADCSAAGLDWTEVPAHGVPAPDCVQAPLSRDNFLGNGGDGGHTNQYNWTLPTSANLACIANDNCNCALRIRYNISTTDLGVNGNRPDAGFIDWSMNGQASPIMQDPTYDASGANMTLAVDTSQFGRTFEDRSFMFHIRPRPSGVTMANRIFNLNVRGKRGNIVQTYPATEYDFVPDNLAVRSGDYIHFQWTGCDTNPAGNAGEGTDRTDRSNMVQIASFEASVPATPEWLASNTPLFDTPELRLHFSMLGQTGCRTMEELLAANNNNAGAVEQDKTNCMKLNAASPYFDGGLIRMNSTGTFYYMNTRNNNFSNRGQKGTLDVVPLLPSWALALVLIGAGAFVLAGGVAGLMLYARSHPHSPIAETFSKF